MNYELLKRFGTLFVSKDSGMVVGGVRKDTVDLADAAATTDLMQVPFGISPKGQAYVDVGQTPRITASYVKPASATAYADRDIIGNSLTANLVTPITFAGAGRAKLYSGKLTGVRCVVQCASSTIVTALLEFDLLVFRAAANTPFAAAGYPADNAALAITAAAALHLVGVFRFVASAWETLGATADVAYQSQGLVTRPYAPFSMADIPSTDLVAVMQARAAWSPGNIVNTFNFVPDIAQD